MLIFSYMLFVPEKQTVEAREAFKKQCSFGSRGNLNRKVISIFYTYFVLRISLASCIYHVYVFAPSLLKANMLIAVIQLATARLLLQRTVFAVYACDTLQWPQANIEAI
jgi:hypothetical protein